MVKPGKAPSRTLVLKMGKAFESHSGAKICQMLRSHTLVLKDRQNFATLSGAESWYMLKSHALALKTGKVLSHRC